MVVVGNQVLPFHMYHIFFLSFYNSGLSDEDRPPKSDRKEVATLLNQKFSRFTIINVR